MKKFGAMFTLLTCLLLIGCGNKLTDAEIFEMKEKCNNLSDEPIMSDWRTPLTEHGAFYSKTHNSCIGFGEYLYKSDEDPTFTVVYRVIKDLMSGEEILSCEDGPECYAKYKKILNKLRD